MSIFITFTFTMSPTDTISDGFFMNLSLISEICTSPSCFTPMSINAPKSITFLTVPVSIIPSFKSSNFKTSERKIGFGMSSLGSLPGFDSSDIISASVISPISSSLAVWAMSTDFSFCLNSSIFSLFFKSVLLNPKFANNFFVAS